MGHFFVVWNPNGGNPTYQHQTLEGAKKEAERLCEENPPFKFYVLEAVGCFEVKPVTKPQWSEILNLPF